MTVREAQAQVSPWLKTLSKGKIAGDQLQDPVVPQVAPRFLRMRGLVVAEQIQFIIDLARRQLQAGIEFQRSGIDLGGELPAFAFETFADRDIEVDDGEDQNENQQQNRPEDQSGQQRFFAFTLFLSGFGLCFFHSYDAYHQVGKRLPVLKYRTLEKTVQGQCGIGREAVKCQGLCRNGRALGS